MKRIGLGMLTVAVVTLAGGLLASVPAAPGEAGATPGTPAGSPTPLACGAPASNGGWGAATASNIRVQLHEIQPVTLPESTPVAMPQTALNVTITNQGAAPLPYKLTDFALLECAGNWHTAIAHGPAPAIQQGTLAPGATVTGWIGFDVPGTSRVAVFVYQIEAPGQTGAEVRFPLAQLPAGTLANLHPPAIGTPTAAACTPGSGGSAGNAVGGNAVGGSGGNGGNATGGSAQGGNGTNGADAIGGSAVGCPSTPAP